MPLPEKQKRYHEKTLLELTIDQTSATGERPTHSDLNRAIAAAQVQAGLDRYRAAAKLMSDEELEAEKHDSARLSRHLEAAGQRRPQDVHAHAIVAGTHANAAVLRVLMAYLRIRIDDPDNGCYLPKSTAATPHPWFPKAVPHSRIHRYNYFFWVRFRLEGITEEAPFRKGLQLIAQHLQEGTFPNYVMSKKGEGLPNGGQV